MTDTLSDWTAVAHLSDGRRSVVDGRQRCVRCGVVLLDRTTRLREIGGGLVSDVIDPPLDAGAVTVISPPLISADPRAPREPLALPGAITGAVPCEKP